MPVLMAKMECANSPLPSGEGWGEGTALRVEPCRELGCGTCVTSTSGFKRGFALTPALDESPRIRTVRKGGLSSPLSLRERGLGVRAKISEAGRRVPEESRVRSSVRPTKQHPHPALSRRERVVYASDRSFGFFRGDSSAPALSQWERVIYGSKTQNNPPSAPEVPPC
jgi:hypothetical protein